MEAVQPAKNPKILLIITCALELMREGGDTGLTMRQVAVRAGMSLSNVQYYFKNKNALLKGIVDYYFTQCEAAYSAHLAETEAETPRERVRELIEFSLARGENLSDVSLIFRELWAIAGRNKDVADHLHAYYTLSAESIAAFLAPLTIHADAIPKLVSLLLPYCEGYSVTASSIPLNSKQTAVLLTDITMSLLEPAAK